MSLLSDAQLVRFRRWLLCLACLQAFLGSGIFYGWPSLYTLCLDAGVYRGECAEHELVCAEQKERLTRIYTVAASVNLLSQLPWGCILDFLGPRVCNLWSTTLVIVGFVLLSLSARGVLVDQYMLAMCLIAGGGPGAQISLFHLSELFPVKRKNTVLSIVTGAFQLGFVVFLLFRLAHTYFDASLADLALLYCIPLLACLLLGGVFWPDYPCIPPDDLDPLSFTSRRPSHPGGPIIYQGKGVSARADEEAAAVAAAADAEEGLLTLANALSPQPDADPSPTPERSEEESPQPQPQPQPPSREEGSPASEPAIGEADEMRHPSSEPLRSSHDVAFAHPPEGQYGSLPPGGSPSLHHVHRSLHALKAHRANPHLKGVTATRGFQQQVTSPAFLLCLVWMSICLFWANFYIGTVAEQLYVKSGYNLAASRYYTDLFTICLPSGVLGIGVFGWLTAELGFFTTIAATSLFGCGFAACTLYLPLSLQPIAFVLYSFHRSFLFSVMFAYLASEFGYRHFGLLSGLVLAVGGALGLAQVTLIERIVVKDATRKHEEIGSGDPEGRATATFQQINQLQLWSYVCTFYFALFVLWKQKTRARKVDQQIEAHTKHIQQQQTSAEVE